MSVGEIEFLTVKDVAARVRVSRPQIYNLISAGLFPPPIKLGARSVWTNADVRQWMQNVATTRRLGRQ